MEDINNGGGKRGGKRSGAGRPRLAGDFEAICVLIRSDKKKAMKQRGNVGEQVRAAIDLYLDHISDPDNLMGASHSTT